jgi:hypothetical protein
VTNDPQPLRPNPYDDPVRIDRDTKADSFPKTIHFEVEGRAACHERSYRTKSITTNYVRAVDRPCPDCLAELAPDREPGTTRVRQTNHETARMLVTCPVCNRYVTPCGVGNHIAGHSPAEFGLSPLAESDGDRPPVATDGGEHR